MVSILEAKNLIMTPKQNKPKWDYDRSWEENLIVKFDLIEAKYGREKAIKYLIKSIHLLLSDQKHDYEILVNTILDKHKKEKQELIAEICIGGTNRDTT
jgi:hypothetical protein